jgi:DNA ligase (NAD+)
MVEVLNTGKIRIKSVKSAIGGKLSGLTFCFTGKLITMSRDEAKNMVAENGGQVKSGVTADLNYLVTNTPNSGSSKNLKAQELGTKIITEQEFLDMLS